jgi:hypothetical protein
MQNWINLSDPVLQRGGQTIRAPQHGPDQQSTVYAVGYGFADDQTLAAAMLDRLLHHAHIVQVTG